MLGAEIAQPPALQRNHPKIAPLRQPAGIRQHQLYMIACHVRGTSGRARHRVRGGGHRDQPRLPGRPPLQRFRQATGYADPSLFKAGTPYGVSAGSGASALPTEDELAVARFQGSRVTQVAKALRG